MMMMMIIIIIITTPTTFGCWPQLHRRLVNQCYPVAVNVDIARLVCSQPCDFRILEHAIFRSISFLTKDGVFLFVVLQVCPFVVRLNEASPPSTVTPNPHFFHGWIDVYRRSLLPVLDVWNSSMGILQKLRFCRRLPSQRRSNQFRRNLAAGFKHFAFPSLCVLSCLSIDRHVICGPFARFHDYRHKSIDIHSSC